MLYTHWGLLGHSGGTQEQPVISGMEQIHRPDIQNCSWASKSPCGWAPSTEQWKNTVGYDGAFILYTSVTFRLLLLWNFEGFVLCWQHDCYSVLLLFGSPFFCLGELTSRNNHGNHINVGWKGPLKIIYSNLPLKAGLSPTLDLVFHVFV